MVVLSDSRYDVGQHLSFEDIAVDSPVNPFYLRVSMKQSKTFKEWIEDHNQVCRGHPVSSGSSAGIDYS